MIRDKMLRIRPPQWAVIYLFVPHEERDLEAAFGETYAGYKKRVRRWV